MLFLKTVVRGRISLHVYNIKPMSMIKTMFGKRMSFHIINLAFDEL